MRSRVFSLVLALVTGFLFGLAPAIEAARERAGTALKDQAASLASFGSQARLRKGFIVAQVALSLVLLVGAGLFTRSLFRLMTEDPGFHAENLLRFSLEPGLNGTIWREASRSITSCSGDWRCFRDCDRLGPQIMGRS